MRRKLGVQEYSQGDQIEIAWLDSDCSSAEYKLTYGDLSQVSTYNVIDQICPISASNNPFLWDANIPANDIYILMLGMDASTGFPGPPECTLIESSWGLDSQGNVRPGESLDFCGFCLFGLIREYLICP